MPTSIMRSVSFTPAAAGRVRVSCSYRASGVGSDFGNSRSVRVFLTQSGVTITSPGVYIPKIGPARAVVDAFEFDVIGGAAVTCGVQGVITGATTLELRDVGIAVDLLQ